MPRVATLVAIAGAAIVAGCSANIAQPLPPGASIAGGFERPAKSANDLIYITTLWETQSGSVDATAYPLDGNGPMAPTIALGGANLGLEFESSGIAVSPKQQVALDGQDGSEGGAAVNVYPPGATGNVAPSAVYSCQGLGEALSLTYDRTGTLYAMNFNPPRVGSNSIFIFPPNSNSGCPANTHLIFGKHTQLEGLPGGIAVWKNHIYSVMENVSQSAILIYPTSANGDIRPSRVISGKKTKFEIPGGIAVDSKGEILIADSYAKKIDIFAANARGDVAPERVIAGPKTQLYLPEDVGVSKDGRIFVVNGSYNSNTLGDSITVYAPNASGDAKPIQVIPGGNGNPQSEIGNPTALALYER
jgi:hypothetical protein